MDLKQLEYFRHVAELGSFTRAAAFLSVVQPALSRQVRQLGKRRTAAAEETFRALSP